MDKLGEPASNVAGPQGGSVADRGGCPQLELPEVRLHLEAHGRIQIRHSSSDCASSKSDARDKLAGQGLAGSGRRKGGSRYGPAWSETHAGRQQHRVSAGANVGLANNIQLVVPQGDFQDSRGVHKTRTAANGGHTQSFSQGLRMDHRGRWLENRAVRATGEPCCLLFKD